MTESGAAPGNRAGVDAFCGTWRLRAAESRYEHGAPPREGLYHMEREREWLLFAARWVAADGRRLEMSYAGIPDGAPHPYDDDPAVADTLTVTLAGPRTLDTVAELRGRVVAHGRRELSDDGRVLTFTQTGTTPDGAPYTNVSVYDRV